MNYFIYKITNNIDNKIYIGKHKTKIENDDYFGSGILIQRAIKKFGKENFTKEILFECQSEEEMNLMEAKIVDEDFIYRDDTYNLKLGGGGGFDYINKNGLTHGDNWKNSCKKSPKNGSKKVKMLLSSNDEFRDIFSDKVRMGLKRYYTTNINPFKGKTHTEESKKKMSNARKGKCSGSKNNNYGNIWITNGIESVLISKQQNIPAGYVKGRTYKRKPSL